MLENQDSFYKNAFYGIASLVLTSSIPYFIMEGPYKHCKRKFRIMTGIRTSTKSIVFVLQMLSIGVEASVLPLSHNMNSIDHQSSLKHPTLHRIVICS